jgi:hypothetical protein
MDVNRSFHRRNLAKSLGLAFAFFGCGNVVPSSPKDGSTNALFDAPLLDGPLVRSNCNSNETAGAFSINFENGPPPELETVPTAPARIEFADGVVKLIPAMASGVTYASIVLKTAVDFRGHRARVQLAKMVATDQPVIALMAIVSTANSSTYAEIIQSLGNIEVRTWNNGAMTLLLRQAYDPIKNRYWQFRESQQRLHVENSEDGFSYANLVSMDTPSWYSSAKIAMAAGTSQSVSGNLGAVHFDNLIDCK